MYTVDVAICTYNRKELIETMNSVASQSCSLISALSLIIADNDVEPTAKIIVDQWDENNIWKIPVKYLHAPYRNISIARNACLQNSGADYLVFIDDDEVATGAWLHNIVKKAIETNADAVFGPVLATFPPTTPQWMIDIDLHSTIPVFFNNQIKSGYTGNTLLNMNSEKIKNRSFDLSKGKTGGEDTDFFSKLYLDGGTLEFAASAIVHEPVIAERATFEWLKNRRFRVGHTYADTLKDRSPSKTKLAKHISTSLIKLLISLFMSFMYFNKEKQRYFWKLRYYFHYGSFRRLLGYSPDDHY